MISGNQLTYSFARSERGMSLVEILVAVLIGLIGMVIIMQVYTVSEERKRTTTGTSDAQISGNIAMFTLERELRFAGYGMVSRQANMLGCNVSAFDSTRATTTLTFPTMAPVSISVGAGGAPDTITIIYGNAWSSVDGSDFAAAAASGAPFPLKNAAGFQVGDLVVASEGGANCSVAEITGFSVGALNNIEHLISSPYSYTDTHGATVTQNSRYNKTGGLGAYTTAARLFSLGRSPVVRQYLVSNDKLKTRSLMPYDSTQDPDNDGWADADIGEGIVNLKAIYGKDTDNNGVVDAWNTTQPVTAADWLQVRAVKIALLVRSGQYEKTPVTVDCVSGSPANNSPHWSVGCFTMTNVADGTDWHNYRYRTYETVVPLRNLIWSTDP